jgi:CMP/dCMP kinase
VNETPPAARRPHQAGPGTDHPLADFAVDGLVIAVDGPSGSGKSSAARGAATRLGLAYLDTGAMYRALTWWMLEHNIDLSDTDTVVKHGVRLSLEIGTDPKGQPVVVDGIDVTAPIRSRRVSNAVSQVAAIPQIRHHLLTSQRRIIGQALAEAGGIVAEGRDIGTAVAPDAGVKVFLTASEHARAERRAAELAASAQPGKAGATPAPATDLTLREQSRRDQLDARQMQRAADAVEIDATDLSLDDVINLIVSLARSKRATA